MFGCAVNVQLYLLLGKSFRDKIAAETFEKNVFHVLLSTFEAFLPTLRGSSEIRTKNVRKTVSQKGRDFYSRAILKGELRSKNPKNHTATHRILPSERIS